MKARQKRLIFVLLGIVAVMGASFLITKAMQGNFYKLYTPRAVLAGEVPTGQVVRIGGLVKEGSLKRSDTEMEARFVVLDKHKNEVTVVTNKILPDLFQEGKSQVARGILKEDGIFYAEEVLAKHDANYMPEEVKDIIKEEHTPVVPVKDGAK